MVIKLFKDESMFLILISVSQTSSVGTVVLFLSVSMKYSTCHSSQLNFRIKISFKIEKNKFYFGYFFINLCVYLESMVT